MSNDILRERKKLLMKIEKLSHRNILIENFVILQSSHDEGKERKIAKINILEMHQFL